MTLDPQADLRSLYLELLRGCLTRSVIRGDEWRVPEPQAGLRGLLARPVLAAARALGLKLVERAPFDFQRRFFGADWPGEGETMIGHLRLKNLQDLIYVLVTEGIPGDLVEAGVWRGGAGIFMRAALRAHGDNERKVWMCDSFEGFPPPDLQRYPADVAFLERSWKMQWWSEDILSVSLEEVQENFKRYGMLDDRVRFVKGWFKDTLPTAPIDRIALLRVDADLYSSTYQALDALYPKLTPGGFVVVDDFFAIPATREAVVDYRNKHGICDPVRKADWSSVYWRRAAEAEEMTA